MSYFEVLASIRDYIIQEGLALELVATLVCAITGCVVAYTVVSVFLIIREKIVIKDTLEHGERFVTSVVRYGKTYWGYTGVCLDERGKERKLIDCKTIRRLHEIPVGRSVTVVKYKNHYVLDKNL